MESHWVSAVAEKEREASCLKKKKARMYLFRRMSVCVTQCASQCTFLAHQVHCLVVKLGRFVPQVAAMLCDVIRA